MSTHLPDVVLPKHICRLMGVSKPTSYRRIAYYRAKLKLESGVNSIPIDQFCRYTGFHQEDVRARMNET